MIIRNQQRLVEFYDSRACVDAFDNTYNAEYMGGTWDVAFFWDHPYRDRSNTNHRRERNNDRDRDEPRGNNRRRSDTVRPREYDHYDGGGHSGGRKDDRYASTVAPPPAAPMHHNVDPRLQYNPQMQHQLPIRGPPMSNLSASNATMPDGQRLEQAQKAQQILSMLAQQPQQPAPQAASLTSPFQPTNLQSPPPPPTAFVPPVPPTEDQASQVQQLLGLLVSSSWIDTCVRILIILMDTESSCSATTATTGCIFSTAHSTSSAGWCCAYSRHGSSYSFISLSSHASTTTTSK